MRISLERLLLAASPVRLQAGWTLQGLLMAPVRTLDLISLAAWLSTQVGMFMWRNATIALERLQLKVW